MTTMSGSRPDTTSEAVSTETSTAIDRWIAQGIITPEQAQRMRVDLAARPPSAPRSVPPGAGQPAAAARPSRGALVTEALGYLGGVIIIAAVGLVVGTMWEELSVAAQLGLVGAVTVLLFAAGALVPAGPSATRARLRSVIWLASSAALGAFLGLAAPTWFEWRDEAAISAAAFGTALYSAALWWVHRRPLQHIAVFGALLVGVGPGVSLLPHEGALPGLAVWGVGAAWLALSWGGVVGSRRLGLLLGAVGTVVGAVTLLDEGWGVAVALATVTALVALALAMRDLPLLGVGSIGTLAILPQAVARYFPGALAPALALLAVGTLLVAAAVVTTRRRTADGAGKEARWAVGTRRAGTVAATLVVVATAATIGIAVALS